MKRRILTAFAVPCPPRRVTFEGKNQKAGMKHNFLEESSDLSLKNSIVGVLFSECRPYGSNDPLGVVVFKTVDVVATREIQRFAVCLIFLTSVKSCLRSARAEKYPPPHLRNIVEFVKLLLEILKPENFLIPYFSTIYSITSIVD